MMTRDQFVTSMQAKLMELGTQIERLNERIDRADGATREELAKRKTQLVESKEKAKARLDEVRDETVGSWEALRGKAEQAYADLSEGLRRAKQDLSE